MSEKKRKHSSSEESEGLRAIKKVVSREAPVIPDKDELQELLLADKVASMKDDDLRGRAQELLKFHKEAVKIWKEQPMMRIWFEDTHALAAYLKREAIKETQKALLKESVSKLAHDSFFTRFTEHNQPAIQRLRDAAASSSSSAVLNPASLAPTET